MRASTRCSCRSCSRTAACPLCPHFLGTRPSCLGLPAGELPLPQRLPGRHTGSLLLRPMTSWHLGSVGMHQCSHALGALMSLVRTGMWALPSPPSGRGRAGTSCRSLALTWGARPQTSRAMLAATSTSLRAPRQARPCRAPCRLVCRAQLQQPEQGLTADGRCHHTGPTAGHQHCGGWGRLAPVLPTRRV